MLEILVYLISVVSGGSILPTDNREGKLLILKIH